MNENTYRLADLFRRMENLVRRGHVTSVDPGRARVRVALADAETDWLPWLTARAGFDRTWWAPEVGEQVLLLSESGDYNNGVVLFGLYRSEHPAPETDSDISLIEYADGTKISYDRGTHALEATLPASGEISLRVGRTILSLRDAEITLTTPNIRMVKA